MFQSSGYFRGINCPFYASGLCERPYCHLRHARVEEKPGKPENGPGYSTSIRPYRPGTVQPFSSSSVQTNPYGQKDIASYSTLAPTEPAGPVETYQTSSSKESQDTKADTCPIPSFSETPQSLPEPDELPAKLDSLPKISGLSKPKNRSPGGSDLPSYIPTPKRVQLIVKEPVPSYNPTPKLTEGSYKKSSSHTVEYDPVKNFAFREKASSVNENVSQSNSETSLVSEPKEIAVLPLQSETVEAVFSADSDNGGCDKEEKSGVESDLTDSDEDVSQTYTLKHNAEEKLPIYAELLTPSSYFTNKLNSPADRKLSTDLNTNSSVKPGENLKSKSSASSNISRKHNSSQRTHRSRQDGSSEKSDSSFKASSSAQEGKKASLKPTLLTSEKKSSSGTSSSCDKSHRSSSSSSSNTQVKHLLTDKYDSNSLKASSEKSSSNSSVKQSHKDKESKHSLKDNIDKSSSHSSKNAEREGSSVYRKGNKHKSSGSSSSAPKAGSHSHKSESSKISHNSVSSSKGLQNGHKKHNKVETSGKSPKHKHSDSKLSENGPSSEIKVKLEHNGSTTSEKRGHRSSSDSNHLSGGHRHKSSSSRNDADVKQERKYSTDKIKSDEKSAGRKSGDSSKLDHMDGNDMKKNDKRDLVRRSSGENCKTITERRISDITVNLFGKDSEGSGSDSDVQIVDAPPEPAPLVYELSESDSDLDKKREDEDSALSYPDDLDMSDTDTFDECLRIFQETERRMAKKLAKSQGFGTTPNTAKMHEVPKVTETSESLLLSVSKKRMAHKAAGEIMRPAKTPAISKPRLSPAEVMHNRIVEMQKRALLRAAKREGRESELPLKLSDTSLPSANKLPSKSNSTVMAVSSSLSEAASSLVSSQKKREAHIPSVKTPTKTVSTSASNVAQIPHIKTPPKTGSTSTSSTILSPNSFDNKSKTESAKSTYPVPDKKWITVASTASKIEKRKAHEPTQTNLARPIIPAEFGTKVPSNVRQRYLNLIIDEYLKFNPEEAAFTKGQEEEQAVYNRASNKNIYLRLAVNAITRIRTEALESQPTSSKKQCLGLSSLSSIAASHPAQSHEATLGGSLAARTSYTLHRSGNNARSLPQKFSGKEMYEHLKKYILTELQLRENGYPRPAEDGSNKVKFYKEDEKDKMLKDNERTCRRCGKRFYVDKDGDLITLEQCFYHYANAFKKRVAGFIDSRYGCCNERTGSKGCQIAKCHVHEKNKTDCLTGYMKTLPASPSSEKNYAVYSLDCEMVYTKAGLELARVTVVGEDCSVKYETLVKPDGEIIDYNTRFSGITEKDMRGVTTTLRDVQAVMLSMACDKTILIGHSLESDLQALKLIHSTVVDTSIVFPHQRGAPYKRALRSLTVDHLQKIIQADDSGHDSKEDAVACMQLMLYKVKADVRRRV